MPSDDSRTSPQRYRQRTRVVAVIVSGAFALPVLFVFGVAVRELSKPPEPSIYAAPPAAPEPSAEETPITAPPNSPAEETSTTAPLQHSSPQSDPQSTTPQPLDPLERIPQLDP